MWELNREPGNSVHCYGGMGKFSRRRRLSLEGGLGFQMVKKNDEVLEGFQFQVDEGLDFICGRKQYLEKDCGVFSSMSALVIF